MRQNRTALPALAHNDYAMIRIKALLLPECMAGSKPLPHPYIRLCRLRCSSLREARRFPCMRVSILCRQVAMRKGLWHW